ncbi:acyl-CoA synthetase (AMP-forming)/AMP-acid ligase II [Humitalea rosea]|uniref:Acyl-CoA synthetase (AMP-forming)/AMP-acid ligase II n=1 Tax=Humitalea rosea TaxID=990373 RepID=A0A2W7HWB6_9PROT|nr:AMP-binding protein [Humitalea rosea]PZW37824.1 acyl-CoA synthetase (AMP-forming)/AMP-acid ligase II [Humitalea rosea]
MATRIWPDHTPAARAALYRAEGLWRDTTLADALALHLETDPGRICLADDGGRYSYAEIADKARRLAGWLEAQGLTPGDVVAFQLPNWHETAAVALATALLGLVCLPIVPIYREAEVGFILAASGARVLLVPETFRGFDHAAMAERLAPGLPALARIGRVRAGAEDDPFAAAPYEGPAHGTAATPWLLMYTSGTTGHPKGVVHTAASLDCELGNVTRWWGLTAGRDATLMASPVTHVTGFLYGLMMPFAYGIPAILMERWDAARAVALIDAEGATFTVSATPFLRELLAAAEAAGSRLASLRVFACGGAPVPPDLIRHAWARFPGLLACRVYGSTEAPTVSLGVASRADPDAAADTDGRIVGHEVRILGEAGEILPEGAEGEIATRGPEMFAGYLDPADDAAAFDADGFFRTGDMGRMTPGGGLVITGRKKDLIIRGGENLSAKEIEDALHRHPAIREAAVVAMPNARLGETCCAVLCTDGTPLTVAGISAFLAGQGLARQKHPERLVIVPDLPRTAAGKVQKYLLRQQIADGA